MFDIARESLKAGEQKIINIPLMRMFTHNQLSIPVKVIVGKKQGPTLFICCLLYTSPSPRDRTRSRMPSSA